MNAVVQTLHQLALRLGGGLDEQLGGGDELAGLRGQQFLGSPELCVAPLSDVSVSAERPGLSDVDNDLSHDLLRLLEDDQPAGLLQSVVVQVGVVHAGAGPSLQGLVVLELTVGVDILVVTIGNPVSIGVSVILQDGFRT